MKNKIEIKFKSLPENEAFARVAVAAFVSQLDPTLEEISDIKTALSEAVSNAIIHGYENVSDALVTVECRLYKEKVEIAVIDSGKGIEDVKRAMEPK